MPGNIKGITIQIDGETTGLSKALGDVNKQSRDLQKELRGVETLLKMDPGNVELVAQKQKILSEQVTVTKEKLDRLKEAQAQVNEQYQKGDIGEQQYRDFQREVIATEQKLKSYEAQLAEASKGQNKFKDAIAKTSESLKNVGSKMTDVGKDMSMKVTSPIVAVGAASIAAFKEVDGAMDTIITKTGATGAAAEELQNSFKNISKTMPVDMQFVGDAIGEMNTQFGLTGTELEKATEQMLKFAQINESDVTTSTQNAKAAIEAYGLSTQDLSMVLDSVTKASQDTGLGVDQIYDAVIKGAPQIKAMGLDFSTAAEVMGRFEQKGLDSSKALTYLSRAQVTWAKDGKTMEQGLAELQSQLAGSSSETDKLALASEVFGTRGASFMLDAVERGALDFDALGNAAENASGTVSSTFDATLDPIDKATVAFNNLKLVGADIATSLQEVLAPILDKIVDALQRFSAWFNNLPPGIREFIVTIALIVAAMGPLLIIAGQIATAIGALAPVFAALTGPIGLVIAAIAGAIAIGTLLYKNWDKISVWLSKVWNGIKDVATNVWEGIKDFFVGLWNSIKTIASTVWEGIKTVILTPIHALKNLLSTTWNIIKDTTSNLWNDLKNTANTVWNGIKDAVMAPIDSVKELLPNVWSGISTNLSDVWNGIKNTASTLWENIKNNIMAPINSLKGLLSVAWDGIKNTASNSWNGLIDTAKNIFNRVKDAILSPFRNLHIPLPHFSFSMKSTKIAGINVPYPDVDVDWYQTGGIFASPRVVGVGEAGPEAVLPIDKLSSILADTLKQMNIQTSAGATVVVQSMTVRDESDIYKISRELNNLIQSSSRARGLR